MKTIYYYDKNLTQRLLSLVPDNAATIFKGSSTSEQAIMMLIAANENLAQQIAEF